MTRRSQVFRAWKCIFLLNAYHIDLHKPGTRSRTKFSNEPCNQLGTEEGHPSCAEHDLACNAQGLVCAYPTLCSAWTHILPSNPWMTGSFCTLFCREGSTRAEIILQRSYTRGGMSPAKFAACSTMHAWRAGGGGATTHGGGAGRRGWSNSHAVPSCS